MIQAFIVGRLGKDCIVNTVNGKNVINFSVAVDVGYGDSKTTQWVECAKWGEKTAVAQFLTKGAQVAVLGEISMKTYSKHDGTNGASLSCRVDKLDLIGGKKEGGPAQESDQGNPFDDGLAF